jgi:hypothetical protein
LRKLRVALRELAPEDRCERMADWLAETRLRLQDREVAGRGWVVKVTLTILDGQ